MDDRPTLDADLVTAPPAADALPPVVGGLLAGAAEA